MAATEQPPIVLHADPEHGGLRTAVIATLIVCLWLCFLLLRSLINRYAPSSWLAYSFALSCIGAIPLALGIAWVFEESLKRIWHSGESITLDGDRLVYTPHVTPGGQEARPQEFRRGLRLNQTNWYYRLKGFPKYGREKRIPDSWLCLATEIQQDDSRLAVFSYLSPEAAAAWLKNGRLAEPFFELPLAELYKQAGKKRRGTRPEVPVSMLHAKEGRYWLAEQRRWKKGVELSSHDFNTLLTYLQAGEKVASEA